MSVARILRPFLYHLMEKHLNRLPQRPILGLAQGIGRGDGVCADALEAKSAVFLCFADA
jgi:hypothetical protein